jgi:hypothetical protein
MLGMYDCPTYPFALLDPHDSLSRCGRNGGGGPVFVPPVVLNCTQTLYFGFIFCMCLSNIWMYLHNIYYFIENRKST